MNAIIKLKRVADLRKEKTDGSGELAYIGLEQIESGTGELVSRDVQNETEAIKAESICNVFEAGDVLFGKLRPYLAKTWIAEYGGCCSSEILVLRPKLVKPDFLKYLLLSRRFLSEISSQGFGSKMPRVDWEIIGEYILHLPSFDEQKGIAVFLDKETTRIDTLVQAKERMLVLLAEKRQALITQAVTRGINADTPLKDSGIDWLGKVPEHWQVKKLKFLAEVNPTKRNYPFDSSSDSEIVFLPMEKVSEQAVVTQDARRRIRDVANGFTYFERGDIIVAKITPCFENGKGALLDNLETEFGFGSTEFHVLRPTSIVDPMFLLLQTRTDRFKKLGEAFMSGAAGQKRVTPSFVAEYLVPFPPVEEQREILTFIKKQTERMDAIHSTAERSIVLLKERRAALITAAVTGQLNPPIAAITQEITLVDTEAIS